MELVTLHDGERLHIYNGCKYNKVTTSQKMSWINTGPCKCPNVKEAVGNLVEFDTNNKPETTLHFKGYALRCKTIWSNRVQYYCQLTIFLGSKVMYHANFHQKGTGPSIPIIHASLEETIIFKLKHGLS